MVLGMNVRTARLRYRIETLVPYRCDANRRSGHLPPYPISVCLRKESVDFSIMVSRIFDTTASAQGSTSRLEGVISEKSAVFMG